MASSSGIDGARAPRHGGTARPLEMRLFRIGGEVRGLAGAALGQTRREGLLVRVRDADGVIGQGEASPLPGYSPDALEACEAQLAAVPMRALPAFPERATAQEAEGERASSDPSAVIGWLERALAASGLRAPAARFALETALLDWLGQRSRTSAATLLGGAAAAGRRIPLSALVSGVEAAGDAYRRGIRVFKLKIAPETLDDDLRLAQALRDAYGTQIRLRFDANGRLPPETALAQLRALARFEPEFVEEPVPLYAFAQASSSPVPLAADESLARPGAWPGLAAACRVLVLKPTLLGGMCACLRLARDAARRGLRVTVTHTFDGPIALAAAAELAAALDDPPLACGLDPHPALAAWPPVRVPQVHPAHLASANRPGLALEAVGPA